MTPIIVSTQLPLTASDFRAATQLPTSIAYWWFPVLTFAGLVAGLWLTVQTGSIFWTVPAFVTLSWQSAFWSSLRPSARASAADVSAQTPTALASVTVWIDNTGVAIVRELGVNAFRWSAIRDVRHDAGTLHFTVEDGAYRYLLPDRWFDDPAAVRQAFREKCPQQGSNL